MTVRLLLLLSRAVGDVGCFCGRKFIISCVAVRPRLVNCIEKGVRTDVQNHGMTCYREITGGGRTGNLRKKAAHLKTMIVLPVVV